MPSRFAKNFSVRTLHFLALVIASILISGCRAPLGTANKVRAAYVPGVEKEMARADTLEDSPFSTSDIAALEQATVRINAYTAQMKSDSNSVVPASAPAVPAAAPAPMLAQPIATNAPGAVVGIGMPSGHMPEIGSRRQPIIPIPEPSRPAPGRNPAIGF